jgi:hypothetical protein
MAALKNTSIKIPVYLKVEIQRRAKNMSKWINIAIAEKLTREPNRKSKV